MDKGKWKKRWKWTDTGWGWIENSGINDGGFQVVGKKNSVVKNVSSNNFSVSSSSPSSQQLCLTSNVPVCHPQDGSNQPNSSRTSVFNRLQGYVGPLPNGAKDGQKSNGSNVVARFSTVACSYGQQDVKHNFGDGSVKQRAGIGAAGVCEVIVHAYEKDKRVIVIKTKKKWQLKKKEYRDMKWKLVTWIFDDTTDAYLFLLSISEFINHNILLHCHCSPTLLLLFFAFPLLIMPIHDLFFKNGDPRLWGNRRSAARSNGRKMRCMERKVQMLQNEADSLSSQLILLQRDTIDMRAVNSELKLLLQDMEQKNHLHDVFKEELDEEIQHLKVAAGQHLGTSMTLPPFGSKKQAEAADRAATPPRPAT
ncbi:hypothetical protein L1987_19122 [Smallanthus sonchifolius]|uniref:Uncharacterized protein n=1 Tax=Smallanthus sonchifolius TaxID=185202 RepID=A0ACB9J2E8_9ASTR|nr:hypothetical protein L1987_19122 [Smallanthus sonchifolius]